jgi:AcrR family transcriptional regulator
MVNSQSPQKVNALPGKKEKILSATFECISQIPYSEINMQMIADRAGVSKGIIHYYFKDKESLLINVLDKLFTDLEAMLDAKLSDVASVEDRLKFTLNYFFTSIKEIKTLYVVLMDFWSQASKNEYFKKACNIAYERYRKRLTETIQAGVASGIFKPIKERTLAMIIIGCVEGLMVQWTFDNSIFDFQEIENTVMDLLTCYLKK